MALTMARVEGEKASKIGGPMVITPFRFSIVEQGLFRGAHPTPKNFRFLKRLQLKTIVSLTPSPNEELQKFCQNQKITMKHFQVPKFKEEESAISLEPAIVAQVLQELISLKNLPLFMHCLDGAHNTGLVIMCLRKLENWTLSVIFNEFTRFTRDSQVHSNESEFVENFKTQIMIPTSIPNWLWQGERISKHPTMRIQLIVEKEPSSNEREKKTKTVHAFWKDPNEEKKENGDNSISRNLQALGLDGTF